MRRVAAMKVVQLGPYPPPHGGVQTNLVAIREYLERHGHSCAAIHLTRARGNAPGVYYPASALELAWLLIGLRVDILHLHLGGDLTKGLAALALFCTLLPGRKTVLSFHSGGYPTSPAGRTAGWWTLRGFIFRRADGVIAVNDEIAAMFRKFGVRPNRLRTILPFAVQLPDPALPLPDRLQTFMASHKPFLLTVGLLEPEYDLGLQIEAMADILERFPRAGLAIVGAGSLEESLRRQIAAKPYAESILLYGDMPRAVTLRAMLECDALLRTTLYDGDSVSVREALYLGTPVIATDNGMRPAGVRLIPISNRERLTDAVSDVVAGGQPRKPMADDGQENLRAVERLYMELRNAIPSPRV
jgi:glycosyltransferase involved in cell wall biosynthesis